MRDPYPNTTNGGLDICLLSDCDRTQLTRRFLFRVFALFTHHAPRVSKIPTTLDLVTLVKEYDNAITFPSYQEIFGKRYILDPD